MKEEQDKITNSALNLLIVGFSFLYRRSCNTTKLSRKQQLFIFGGSFLVIVLGTADVVYTETR